MRDCTELELRLTFFNTATHISEHFHAKKTMDPVDIGYQLNFYPTYCIVSFMLQPLRAAKTEIML